MAMRALSTTTTITTAMLYCAAVANSPIDMMTPPSPHKATTRRSGQATLAPSEAGSEPFTDGKLAADLGRIAVDLDQARRDSHAPVGRVDLRESDPDGDQCVGRGEDRLGSLVARVAGVQGVVSGQ